MRHHQRSGIVFAGAALLAALATFGVAGRAAGQAADGEDGWGAVRDGLRARLGIEQPRAAYGYGATLAVKLTLRNAGTAPVALRLRAPGDWTVGISAGNLVTLDTVGGEAQQVELAPGEERTFDGPRLTLVLLGDGTNGGVNAVRGGIGAAGDTGATIALGLLPGRYTLRCPMPFWQPDADDPNRATALRAAPGTIPFALFAPPNARVPRLLPLPIHAGEVNVAWGEPADGLQAGLRPRTHAGAYRVGEEMACDLLVRNVTDADITFRAPSFQAYDWSPMVTDRQGNSQRVSTVFVSGLRPMTTYTLRPRQSVVVGRPVLRIGLAGDAEENHASGATAALDFAPPTLLAPAGSYTVSHVIGVGIGVDSRQSVNVVLLGGKLAFAVAPKALAR